MLVAEAGHLQRIGNATASLFGQRLDHRIAVIVRDKHGVLRLQFGSDGRTVVGLFLCAQHPRLFRRQMGLDQKAFGNLGHRVETSTGTV